MATNIFDKSKQVQSKRSNHPVSNSRTDFNTSNDHSDFQIVIQFELRRERQKTRILQQRLHNKQVFIQQMKEYQDQLTLAFQKCQQQLIIAKKTLEKHFIIEADYQQQISELKHLVIRLEDQINIREKDLNKRKYNSVKKEEKVESSPFKKRQVRAKTLMNNQEDSPRGLKDALEEQLVKQSKKITKFIRQFLMMSGCFCEQQKEDNLKNRLKIAWKWIKQVVKQWNDLLNQRQIWQKFIKKATQKTKFSTQADLQQILSKILTTINSR